MRSDERLVRVASKLLPAATRETRLEEWLADLDGAESLGIPRRDVVLGAISYALSHNRVRAGVRRMGPKAWAVSGLAAVGILIVGVPGVAIAAYAIDDARGIVTVEQAADGSERTVHWREYPGSADVDTGEVLAGPSLQEGIRTGEAMVSEMRAALTAEFGLNWALPPAGQSVEDSVHPTENRYGGWSMLSVVNAPTSQSTTVPSTWEEKQRAIDIIGEVAARHGFGAPRLDQQRWETTDEDLIRNFGGVTPETQVIVSGMVEGPTGQWLMFTFQDLSKDIDGRFAEQFEGAAENGWERNSVSLMYGANGLLSEADRAEFVKRLAPYEGLEHPEPQIS